MISINRNILMLTFISIIFAAFTAMKIQHEPPKPWPVPDEYKNMENPAKGDAESLKMGGMLYKRYCVSCHGRTGLGDGPKARGLNIFSGDFTDDSHQIQTDGEHFYKILKGRGEMPGYENKIPVKDIWTIVSYMRTFEE